MMKKFNKKLFILLIITMVIFISIIIMINKSFALEEKNYYKVDYILNHDWVKYM